MRVYNMKSLKFTRKKLILSLLFLLLITNMSGVFSYWAQSVLGDSINSSGSIGIGEWKEEVTDPFDFVEMITTTNNYGNYVLTSDIDLATFAPWTDNRETVFSGTFDGNGYTIKNIDLLNYRGIFGILEGATVKNLRFDNIDFSYSSDANSIGVLAGRLSGQNNLIENIEITGSILNKNGSIAGSLIGYAAPLPIDGPQGSAIIRNIKVTDTTVTGNMNNASYGSGGLIGSIDNFNITLEDIYLDVAVTMTGGHAGGVVGAVNNTSTLTMNRVVVRTARSGNGIYAATTTRFAAAFVGINNGTVSLTDGLFTGRLRAATSNNYGIQRGSGNNVTSNNVRSYYSQTYTSSFQNLNQTRYNAMSGQKPTWSTTVYISSQNTLDASWWQNNYSVLYNMSVWTYDSSTRLMQTSGEIS